MKEVEIELYQHPYSTAASRQVLEFNDNAKVKAILDTIKDLARKCKWHKYASVLQTCGRGGNINH